MKKSIIIVSVFIASCLMAEGQTYLGINVSPAISTFHHKNRNATEFYTLPVNYGLKLDFINKRLAISYGLSHFTQGHGFEIMRSPTDLPGGASRNFDAIIRVRAIMFSQEINYSFIERQGTHFIIGGGCYFGIIYSQKFINTSEPFSAPMLLPLSSSSFFQFLPVSATERVSDIDLFESFYVGVNLGIGWRQKITDKINFQIRPNFLYQIRRDRSDSNSNPQLNPNMMTIALYMGIYYRLN